MKTFESYINCAEIVDKLRDRHNASCGKRHVHLRVHEIKRTSR